MFVVLHPWESPRVPLIPLFITNLAFLCISSQLNHNAVSLWSHEYLSLSLYVCVRVNVCHFVLCKQFNIALGVSVNVSPCYCLHCCCCCCYCKLHQQSQQQSSCTANVYIYYWINTDDCLFVGRLTGLPAIPLPSQALSDELDYMNSLAVSPVWPDCLQVMPVAPIFDTLSHTIE